MPETLRRRETIVAFCHAAPEYLNGFRAALPSVVQSNHRLQAPHESAAVSFYKGLLLWSFPQVLDEALDDSWGTALRHCRLYPDHPGRVTKHGEPPGMGQLLKRMGRVCRSTHKLPWRSQAPKPPPWDLSQAESSVMDERQAFDCLVAGLWADAPALC